MFHVTSATPEQIERLYEQITAATVIRGDGEECTVPFPDTPPLVAEHMPASQDEATLEDSLYGGVFFYRMGSSLDTPQLPRKVGLQATVSFDRKERLPSGLVVESWVVYDITSEDGVKQEIERTFNTRSNRRIATAASQRQYSVDEVFVRMKEVLAGQAAARQTEKALGLLAVGSDEAEEISTALATIL